MQEQIIYQRKICQNRRNKCHVFCLNDNMISECTRLEDLMPIRKTDAQIWNKCMYENGPI